MLMSRLSVTLNFESTYAAILENFIIRPQAYAHM